MPSSVEVIEIEAFSECEKLESIKISPNVKVIPFECFANCTNLRTVVMPDSVIKIDELAFLGCEYLDNVVLSKNLEFIGDYAFSRCDRLESIVLPDKLRIIGHEAFAYCKNLRTILLPKSVRHIEVMELWPLKKIISESPRYKVVDGALYEVNVKTKELKRLVYYFSDKSEFTLPESVTSIDESVFSENRHLEKFNLTRTSPQYQDSLSRGAAISKR